MANKLTHAAQFVRLRVGEGEGEEEGQRKRKRWERVGYRGGRDSRHGIKCAKCMQKWITSDSGLGGGGQWTAATEIVTSM